MNLTELPWRGLASAQEVQTRLVIVRLFISAFGWLARKLPALADIN